MLEQPCSEEEIAMAIKGMAPYKAPGHDGIHAAFFQRMWPTTGQLVMLMIQKVMAGEELPPGIAKVLVVLVPKIEHPHYITQFCPINLCNVVYKIITKLISNWLKEVWEKLIALSQASFIPSR